MIPKFIENFFNEKSIPIIFHLNKKDVKINDENLYIYFKIVNIDKLNYINKIFFEISINLIKNSTNLSLINTFEKIIIQDFFAKYKQNLFNISIDYYNLTFSSGCFYE